MNRLVALLAIYALPLLILVPSQQLQVQAASTLEAGIFFHGAIAAEPASAGTATVTATVVAPTQAELNAIAVQYARRGQFGPAIRTAAAARPHLASQVLQLVLWLIVIGGSGLLFGRTRLVDIPPAPAPRLQIGH